MHAAQKRCRQSAVLVRVMVPQQIGHRVSCRSAPSRTVPAGGSGAGLLDTAAAAGEWLVERLGNEEKPRVGRGSG